MNGFIKLHRKMLGWGWYHDVNTKVVFLHLLLSARFDEGEWRGVKLKPGQTVIGRKKLSTVLGISEQAIRTALDHLKSTKEITTESTKGFTIVTIENWTLYQAKEDEATKEATNDQPASNQRSTNDQPQRKNVKNDKNVKKERKREGDADASSPSPPKVKEPKTIFGEFGKVKLTASEHDRLAERLGTEARDGYIERLDGYIASTGKSYKDHYATILNWVRKDGAKRGAGQEAKEGAGQYSNLEALRAQFAEAEE